MGSATALFRSVVCLSGVLLLASAGADAGRMGAWYRFEDPEALGKSVGDTPWPAVAFNAQGEAEGKAGFGLALPGTRGNGLYLPNPVTLFGKEATAGTIALWVKPALDPAEEEQTRCIIDFMRDCGNTQIDGYEIVIFTDKGSLKAKPSLTCQMEVPAPLRKGEWTHIALTWDAARGAAMYVDGEKAAERNGAFEPTALEAGWPGRVGCHTASGGFPFAGTIDEVRVMNYCLTAQEVAEVRDIVPESPKLKVSGTWGEEVTVANREKKEQVTLSFETWMPGKHAQPPFHGALPISFTERFWTAGASPTERTADGMTLQPRKKGSTWTPSSADYFGPSRARLMCGTGLARSELTLDGSVANAVCPGLTIETERTFPLVYLSTEPFVFEAVITNGSGKEFFGTIRADLSALDGKQLASKTLHVLLNEGKDTSEAIDFGLNLAPGAYQLHVYARKGDTETLVEKLRIHATSADTCANLCDIGAAYVGQPDAGDVLAAMSGDGVALVRLGGKNNGYSFGKNISAVLAHGMKVWRTPAASYGSVCADKSKRERLEDSARELGTALGDNPGVMVQTIAGEGLTYPPCYCDACNKAFRKYLKKKYNTLFLLNGAWDTKYKEWEDIHQLGSPEDVDYAAERLKMMQVARELPKANTERWKELFTLEKPKSIEWKRWHDQLLTEWYEDFADAFRDTNEGRTPIAEQPCWPNFKSHVLFALGRTADVGGMDLYLPGELPTTLGYASELFLNFDLNASVFHGWDKPVMVHEMYVQDNSPAGLAQAQGWWLTGRGYNLVTYFTYNYYHEGTRAGQPLVFGLFDKQGKPYACYESFKRFGKELRAFHATHDLHSLRRMEPRVALFMGDDVSLANSLETGGETWRAAAVHGHNGSYWLTERSGFPVEFVNDDTMDRLSGKKVLVVPWCHVVRSDSVAKIVAFARDGGTLVIDGPLGLYDEIYRRHEPFPGGGTASGLGIRLEDYEDKPNTIVWKDGIRIPSQGVPVDINVLSGGEVLAKDAENRPAVVRTSVGLGKAVYFLTSLGRRHRGRSPDPGALALWQSVLADAGLAPRFQYVPREKQASQAPEDLDHGGAGLKSSAPLSSVSCRVKTGGKEICLFMTNFFAPTDSELQLHLPPGFYKAVDGLTGEPVELRRIEDTPYHRLPANFPAFGARSIRVLATQGEPFSGWRTLRGWTGQ